jgi:hypothetical protein
VSNDGCGKVEAVVLQKRAPTRYVAQSKRVFAQKRREKPFQNPSISFHPWRTIETHQGVRPAQNYFLSRLPADEGRLRFEDTEDGNSNLDFATGKSPVTYVDAGKRRFTSST